MADYMCTSCVSTFSSKSTFSKHKARHQESRRIATEEEEWALAIMIQEEQQLPPCPPDLEDSYKITSTRTVMEIAQEDNNVVANFVQNLIKVQERVINVTEKNEIPKVAKKKNNQKIASKQAGSNLPIKEAKVKSKVLVKKVINKATLSQDKTVVKQKVHKTPVEKEVDDIVETEKMVNDLYNMEESDQSDLTQGVAKVDNILDKYKFLQEPQCTEAKPKDKPEVYKDKPSEGVVLNKSINITSSIQNVAPKRKADKLETPQLKKAKVKTVKKEPTRCVGAENSTKSVEVKKECFESLSVGSVDEIQSILNKYNMKKTELAPINSKPMEKETASSEKVVKSEDSSETHIGSVDSILNKYQHITISSVKTETTSNREEERLSTKATIGVTNSKELDGKLKSSNTPKDINKKIKAESMKFSCDKCDKKFSNVLGLKKHYTVHTGEKPYKCNQCEEGFRTTGMLVSHTKKVHDVTGTTD